LITGIELRLLDVAYTVCWLLGLPVPASNEGASIMLLASRKQLGVAMDPFASHTIDELWLEVFAAARKKTWPA